MILENLMLERPVCLLILVLPFEGVFCFIEPHSFLICKIKIIIPALATL